MRASDLQRLVDTAKDYNHRFTVTPPLRLLHGQGGGMAIDMVGSQGFWAQLTEFDGTSAYGWHEVVPFSDGTFQAKSGGRTGTISADSAYEVNGKQIQPPQYVWMRTGWQQGNSPTEGNPGQEYVFSASPSISWVRVLYNQNTPQIIYIGHQVQADLTSGSSTVVVTSGYLNSSDVGSIVVGAGIPSNTTITKLGNDSFTMSSNATATGTAVTVNIYNGSILGYAAATEVWDKETNYGFHNHNTTQNCWFLSYNQPDPNSGAVSPHNLYPLQNALQPFLCVQVATDYQGWPIYVWPYDPGCFWDTGPSTAPSGLNSSIAIYGLPNNSGLAPARISMGTGAMIEGFVGDDGSATGQDVYVAPGANASYMGVASQPYLCDTGTDASGNQIINGRIVSIGGNNTTSNGIDGGTW